MEHFYVTQLYTKEESVLCTVTETRDSRKGSRPEVTTITVLKLVQ